ncbi:MAG: hypothetical protein IT503_19410 [Burkholderiaceae bacterium]|nr:hypothetical protein [Burkholderiaceae bacterium]
MAKVRAPYENRDNVALARLHLDPENPRHDPIADEDKIIGQLFRAEQVLAVVKDIAAKGGVSPLDRIGVIEMADNPGHFIVAEGNRRACALKVLHDPQKAPTTALRASIAALAKEATVPSKLSVVVFRDREAARPWLSLRHLGLQNGAGTRPWNNEQKTRFARGASPDHLALAVLDRAIEGGWIDREARKKIGLTTLTRYLGNPVVRAALGLGDRTNLVFTHEHEEVDAALRQFIQDALPKSGGASPLVNSRTKSADWRAYGQSLHTRGIAPTTQLPAPIEPPAPTKHGGKKPRRNPRSPDDRAYVPTSTFVVTHRDKALQRLLTELRGLKPDDGFVYSTNYLVRAVVERVMVLYAKKGSFYQPKMADSLLMRKCHEALEADGVSTTELKNLRVAYSNLDATHSLDTLGAAVHGAHLPTRRQLIAVWDNWEPVMKLMLDRL